MALLAHAGELAGGRSDLPIPEQLFGVAAAVVLIVSFIGLAVLWPTPRLERGGFRAFPRAVSRVLLSRPVAILCGAAGVFLLGLVVWSGLTGVQVASANFAPTFVYVVFWLGLVPVSLIFGDVFRALNPWRAIGRAVAGWRASPRGARCRHRCPIPSASDTGRQSRASSPSRCSRWSSPTARCLRRSRSRRWSTRPRPSSRWRSTASRRGAIAARRSASTSTSSAASRRWRAGETRSACAARCRASRT